MWEGILTEKWALPEWRRGSPPSRKSYKCSLPCRDPLPVPPKGAAGESHMMSYVLHNTEHVVRIAYQKIHVAHYVVHNMYHNLLLLRFADMGVLPTQASVDSSGVLLIIGFTHHRLEVLVGPFKIFGNFPHYHGNFSVRAVHKFGWH